MVDTSTSCGLFGGRGLKRAFCSSPNQNSRHRSRLETGESCMGNK